MTKSVAVTGNPVDGLRFYGPFDTEQEALDWADSNDDGECWWIAEMLSETEAAAEAAGDTPPEPEPPEKSETVQMIEDCEAREAKLSDWERGFIDDIGKQVGDGRELSIKQRDRLTLIWDRVTG